MRKKLREDQLNQILSELETLQNRNKATNSDQQPDATRRECLKILESRTAVVRLLQSEDRLRQQLVLGASSFLGGSVLAFLLKLFLDS